MTDISRIRNIAIAGGHHAGKTTLVEAILERCGAIARRGNVADGTTTTDHEPEAIDHERSTGANFAHAHDGETSLTLVDCPGYVDFFDETKLVLAAVDAVAIVVEPEPHKVAQLAQLVAEIEARRLPHCFIVNKLDRPEADFGATLDALQRAHGRHVVAEHVPFGTGDAFVGYVDLGERRAVRFGDAPHISVAIPGDIEASVDARRTQLLEALGDFDDHLFEELVEGIEPSPAEIERDLCAECAHDQIVPVLVASALGDRGIAAIVDAFVRWFPAPDVNVRVDASGGIVAPDPKAPVVAQICKTIVNPQSGKLSIVRVLRGTLSPDTLLENASQRGRRFRATGLFRLQGKRAEPVTAAGPGEIVALGRLDGAVTGDTLATPGALVVMATVVCAEPVYAVAIRPRERLDEAKLTAMLDRLLEEDPALRVARAPLTNELQLMGAGEVHVATATERLARKYRLVLDTHDPAVPYRETITRTLDHHARYKHQTGGHGQFADVTLRIEPRERGYGIGFSEAIVGGVVPRQFFPAVEKGVRDALASGPLVGAPVVDVHVTLIDGTYHAVDSSEASFRTVAALAIREALPNAGAVVLEPITRVETIAPHAYTSAIVALLSSKRAHIGGFEANAAGDREHVRALVPQAHLAHFCTELRTATQGLGRFTTAHDRFEIAPEMARAT